MSASKLETSGDKIFKEAWRVLSWAQCSLSDPSVWFTGSFSCEVGLAKQRTDFSVRTRPSFEFFSEAWQVLRMSVFLLAASAENKRWFLEVWVWSLDGPFWSCLSRGFSYKIPKVPVGPWKSSLLYFSCVWEAPRALEEQTGSVWFSFSSCKGVQDKIKYLKIEVQSKQHHGADRAPHSTPSPSTTPLGLVCIWVPNVKARKTWFLKGIVLKC